MATTVLFFNGFTWALFSAVFAANFAKIGLAYADSDLAALIRAVIIFGVHGALICDIGKCSNPFERSGKAWLFLVRWSFGYANSGR